MKKTTFYLFKLTTIAIASSKEDEISSEYPVKTATEQDFTTFTILCSSSMNVTANTNTNDKNQYKYEI
jgi:hypothetical protein